MSSSVYVQRVQISAYNFQEQNQVSELLVIFCCGEICVAQLPLFGLDVEFVQAD